MIAKRGKMISKSIMGYDKWFLCKCKSSDLEYN